MAPKARTIDQERVEALLAQGTPRREIARLLDIPESTLRHHLKQREHGGPRQVHQGPPAATQAAPRENTPGIHEVHQGNPQKPALDSIQGPPQGALEPPLSAIVDAWPDLQGLLAWWQDRQQGGADAGEKLERVTYHVSPRWIAAVKREADQTGESYAAVVNRAFRQYFAGRDT